MPPVAPTLSDRRRAYRTPADEVDISEGSAIDIPVQLLRLGRDLDLLLLLFWLHVSPASPHCVPRLRHHSEGGATHLGRPC